jgi:hypothetical protein
MGYKKKVCVCVFFATIFLWIKLVRFIWRNSKILVWKKSSPLLKTNAKTNTYTIITKLQALTPSPTLKTTSTLTVVAKIAHQQQGQRQHYHHHQQQQRV